eukprot:TRINITY_DN5680_c0_g1_i1.p1 TRINITY_DN5680_c0_g1~~TRINITY_DN5680_c0_g1_i1.p1  ORF type:complete len:418 (+),score=58.44 TRINITY_DN5680_c0_g1_i1:27-1280(+)
MFGLGRQLLGPRLQGVVPAHIASVRPAGPGRQEPNTSGLRFSKTEASSPTLSSSKNWARERNSPNTTPKGTRRVQNVALSLETIREMVHPDLLDEGGSSIFSGEEHLFLPPGLEGCNVLVLGCKSGLETYACSALVGSEGKVQGVDVDTEEIAKANLFLEYHTKLFRYKRPNVEFFSTPLHDLSVIPSGSVDVIVSVCSLNSQEQKRGIFKECFRVLKEGGEIYFSDVLSNKRLGPKDSANSTMYKEDFRRLIKSAGFEDIRMISREDISEAYLASPPSSCAAISPVGIPTIPMIGTPGRIPRIETFQNLPVQPKAYPDPLLSARTSVQYLLVTVRAFKLSSLEDMWEDYGQIATYFGTNSQKLNVPFCLDDNNIFYLGRGTHVDANTAEILGTRYKAFFDVTAKGNHEGIFTPAFK